MNMDTLVVFEGYTIQESAILALGPVSGMGFTVFLKGHKIEFLYGGKSDGYKEKKQEDFSEAWNQARMYKQH